MSDCLFCRILAGELPGTFVHRGERVAAFLDIHPINPGHALVVPTAHAASLAELAPDDGAALFRVAQRLAAAERASGLRCEGVNLHLADGAVAGQEVFHVHLHVIPRFGADGFGLKLPRGYGAMSERSALEEVAAALRAALGPAG